MPASAAAKYSRKFDIYRRMLVTDICSVVYKSSWLSQGLDFGSWSNIYSSSDSVSLLCLLLFAIICTFLDLSGAPGSMIPDSVEFACHH